MKKQDLNTIKTSGFKVPKDYFESLEDAILAETKLDSQPKNTGFKIPDGYLDRIENLVISKLEQPEVKVFRLVNKKMIITISSIAAAILLLFNLNIFNASTTLENLDYQTVENYVLDEIDTNDLSLLIEDTDLLQTDFIDYTQDIDTYIDDIDLNELYQE